MAGTNGKHSQVAELLGATVDLVKESEGMKSPVTVRPSSESVWLSRAFMVMLTVYLTTVFMVLLLPVFKLLGAK